MDNFKNIESFEAAAISLAIDPSVLPGTAGLPEKHATAIVSNYKLFIISEAAWAGKVIDWNNYSQYRYYPWFDMETYDTDDSGAVGSVSGFSFDGYAYDDTYTRVGSRLCFPTRAMAEYAGKQHLQLYRDVFVIEK